MGNTHGQSKGSADLSSALKGYPMYFHSIHSPNIQVSNDKRSAKRIESFCKGICFGSRPVAINERVYIKFAEISTSWSGVLRFGYTSNEPTDIDPNNLPRYACPDLTNRPGFWAKALPERMAEQGNVLFFQVTRQGDVMYGINDAEKGLFFGGVPANVPLWPVVDIYGNTTSMQFVDGRQTNNITSPVDESLLSQLSGPSLALPPASPAANLSTSIPPPITPTLPPYSPPSLTSYNPSQPSHTVSSPQQSNLPYPLLPSEVPPSTSLSRANTVPHSSAALQNSLPNLAISHYTSMSFRPFPFHPVHGRNVSLSSDKTVAVRLLEEYCNGYVFSPRPFQCGERIIIQILSVDRTYEGGIAFGMTACDPKHLRAEDLPDDSDFLLDRPEYWVVNKDVCTNAEVRDELCFHLNHEGEVRYGRNGHHITTLMHIDKTLPMWAFFDVYGSTQKIKCLGLGSLERSPSVSAVHHRNPPPHRQHSTPDFAVGAASGMLNPPPRPPPPRASPVSVRSSPGGSPVSFSRREDTTPPQLPPKQRTQTPSPSFMSSAGTSLSHSSPHPKSEPLASPTGALGLPPPLIPVPKEPAPVPPKPLSKASPPKPAIPPRLIDKHKLPPPIPSRVTETLEADRVSSLNNKSKEENDNANNECCVCWETPPNCVVYTCGHMCMCYSCALDIKDNQDGLCPMCRQEIKDIIKIFRS